MHIVASFLILAIQILGSTSTGVLAVVSRSTVSDRAAATFGNVSALATTATFLAAGTYTSRRTTQSTTPGNLILMSTFQAISVKAPFSGDDNDNNSALVQFRPAGSSTWLNAYDPFIDRRASLGGVLNPYANQARVSIVGLTANTSYDVQVTWTDTDGVVSQPAIASISTLTYTPPTGGSTIIVTNGATLATALSTVRPGQTIHMNPGTYAPFSISRSGTSAAWITVEGDSGGGTIVSGTGVSQNVSVNANFMIIQHLTLSASDSSGITLSSNNHVFVQDNTLQNISAQCASNPSRHYGDGGITVGKGSNNIFVLRNSVNSTALNNPACTLTPIWDSPGTGIQWYNVTTLVIEGNTTTGGFRDALASDNSGNQGENVDIVGNTVSGYKDDGPESKGGNVNIRIWNNHISADAADTCIASNTNTPTNLYGPVYIFRNTCRVTTNNPSGTTVFKLGGAGLKTFLFHNSIDASLAAVHWDGFVGAGTDTVALNNTVQLAGSAIDYGSSGSVFDYNVYYITSGASFAFRWNSNNYDTLRTFRSATAQEAHGKQQNPLYKDTQLHIDSTSPAFDAGVIIPNFNDARSAWPYSGSAPDIGAYER